MSELKRKDVLAPRPQIFLLGYVLGIISASLYWFLWSLISYSVIFVWKWALQ